MSTALQLVNRIRRKLRMGPDLSAFSSTDELTNVLLDMLNEGKREVLEHREWDFDIRHDGILKCVKERTYTTGTSVVSLTNIGNTGVDVSATYSGSLRSRVMVTSDATYGDTSFIITNITNTGGNDVYTIGVGWPGSTDGAASLKIFASEYILPSTVRDVLSVRHEEGEIALHFLDKSTELDPALPNPNLDSSDQPEAVYVGSTVRNTTLDGADPSYGLGMMVHPIPSENVVIHYSYRYRHPDLTAATSEIENVPAHVEDLIVDAAVARAQMSGVANDPTLAALNVREVRRRADEAVKMTRPDPGRRRSLRSHDRRATRDQFGSRPRNPRTFYTP